MELTIGEKIMVIRHRKGIKITDLASKTFPELSAPHHKLKKIESGIQEPTDAEIELIAKNLGINQKYLSDNDAFENGQPLFLRKEFMDLFPGIDRHFNLLNTGYYMGREFCIEVFKKIIEEYSNNK